MFSLQMPNSWMQWPRPCELIAQFAPKVSQYCKIEQHFHQSDQTFFISLSGCPLAAMEKLAQKQQQNANKALHANRNQSGNRSSSNSSQSGGKTSGGNKSNGAASQ